MQLLPVTVTIPANQTEVTVNVLPIIDNMPEGIEIIKVYALAGGGCGAGTPTDSTTIQIRDYDTLGISPDTAIICKNSVIQLIASAGYSVYQWDANPSYIKQYNNKKSLCITYQQYYHLLLYCNRRNMQWKGFIADHT